MKRVEVWHILDDTVAVDRLTAAEVNAKIKTDGGGYVKTPGSERLYRRIDRIVIDEDHAPCVNCTDPACQGCWGADTHRADDWRP